MRLRKSEWLDEWYLLVSDEGYEPAGVNIEGTLSEWFQIANAIKQNSSIFFKRCCVRIEDDTITFYSPRNSSEGDVALCCRAEAEKFADGIINEAMIFEI
jgi:hypothetical protein